METNFTEFIEKIEAMTWEKDPIVKVDGKEFTRVDLRRVYTEESPSDIGSFVVNRPGRVPEGKPGQGKGRWCPCSRKNSNRGHCVWSGRWRAK